jgi:hypothetical protein
MINWKMRMMTPIVTMLPTTVSALAGDIIQGQRAAYRQ